MTYRTRTLSTIAAAAIAVTAAMSTVSGQPPAGRGRGGPGAGPGGPIPELRQLNLSDAQREQIRALVDQRRSEGDQAPGRKLAELQRSLRAAIFADTPDPSQIDQLRSAIAEAEAAALAARIDFQLKVAQILTPEQRKQARESTGPRLGRRARGL
jgi:Spy/CpxP family protein refolding chaperone